MSEPARDLCEELGQDLADSQEFQLRCRSSVPDVFDRLVESGVLEAPSVPDDALPAASPPSPPLSGRLWRATLVLITFGALLGAIIVACR